MTDKILFNIEGSFALAITEINEKSEIFGYHSKLTKLGTLSKKVDDFNRLRSIYDTMPKFTYRLTAGLVEVLDLKIKVDATSESQKLVQLINLRDAIVNAKTDIEKFDCICNFNSILSSTPDVLQEEYEIKSVSYPVSYITDLRAVEVLTKRLITIERDYIADSIVDCVEKSRDGNQEFSIAAIKSWLQEMGVNENDHLGSLLAEDKAEIRTKIAPFMATRHIKRLRSPAAFYASKEEVHQVQQCQDLYMAYAEEGNYEELKHDKTINYSHLPGSITR